jgi:hypothetical protein
VVYYYHNGAEIVGVRDHWLTSRLGCDAGNASQGNIYTRTRKGRLQYGKEQTNFKGDMAKYIYLQIVSV